MKFLLPLFAIALVSSTIVSANDESIPESNEVQKLFIEDNGEVFVNIKSLAPATVSSLGVNSEASTPSPFKARRNSLQVGMTGFSNGSLNDDLGAVFDDTTLTGFGLTYLTRISNDFSFFGEISSATGRGSIDSDFARDFIGNSFGSDVDLSRKEVGLGLRYNVFEGAFIELTMTRVLLEADGLVFGLLSDPSIYMRAVGNSFSVSPGYMYKLSERFYMDASIALVYTSIRDIEIDKDEEFLLASGRFTSFVVSPQFSVGVTF